MTKRKSLISAFAFALALSLLCGALLSGVTFRVHAADEKTIIPLVEAAVTAPVAGETISTTATVSGELYKLNKVEWYRGTETTTENKMNPLAKFVEGQQYTVTVKFAISNFSYCFNSESTLAKINGQSATVVSATEAFITVKYTFTAESVPTPEHNVILENGTFGDGSTSGTFKEGAEVTITADAAPEGKVFSEWVVVSGNINITIDYLETTKFEMGDSDVTIKAVYKTIVRSVDLTVKSPVAGAVADNKNDLSYPTDKGYTATLTWYDENWVKLAEGATFELGAKYYAEIEVSVTDDYIFSDTIAYLNGAEKSKSDAFPTSFGVVGSFIAAEKPIVYSDVKVTGGRAEIDEEIVIKAESGKQITIISEPAEGQTFEKWEVVSGNVTIEDANNATATFTMPSGNVEIKAVYKDSTPSGGDEETSGGGEETSGGGEETSGKGETPGTDNPGGETPGTDDPSGENPSTENKGLSGGAIAGIVVGSVAVAGIGGFAIFWFAIRKKSFAELIAAIKSGFGKK